MSKVKRWSFKRKQEVLRLLRGESLDALSRETGSFQDSCHRFVYAA